MMKDDSVQILSSQLSSKLIDEYTKWKNKNKGPSQGNFWYKKKGIKFIQNLRKM